MSRGAGVARTPGSAGPPAGSPGGFCGERGSQSIEFALTLPFVVLLVAVVAHAAVVAADLITAQSVAFQAARVAAVDDDVAVRAAVERAAGERPVEVAVDPPTAQREIGELVEASVRVRSAAFGAFGITVWLPASASLRVERR